jgi:hypothetical protein
MRAEDLRLVARTFAAAFPAPYLFQAGSDLVFVGAGEPLRLDEAALRARLAGPLGEPLAALGLRSPGRLLSLLLRDPAGVRRFARQGELNTDDRLVLEFRAGRAWFEHAEAAHAKLLSIGRAPPGALLRAPAGPAFLAEVEAGHRFRDGIRSWLQRERTDQADAFDALAQADPADRFAARMRDGARLARLFELLGEEDLDEARRLAAVLGAQPDLDDAQRLDLALAYRELGDVDAGRALAEVVRARRDSPRARRLAAP